MFLKVIRGIGELSMLSNGLLFMWFGMRDWRRFFLKEPFRAVPAWANRLTLILWIVAAPWLIEGLFQKIKDFLRVDSTGHLHATKLEWFVVGFIVLCILLNLAARYLPLERDAASS